MSEANVYLLWASFDECGVMMGAFSTLELAQTAHNDGHEPEWVGNGVDRWACYFRIAAVPPKGGTYGFELLTMPVVDGFATLPDGRLIASSEQAVTVPVMPDGLPDIGIPAESCDYWIERHPVDA